MKWALRIVFASLISTVGEVTAVTGQTPAEPAKASPAPVKTAPMADIAFYLARGEADACGRGCNEWIAAEGRIDPGAPQRLRRLIAKLGRRRPPIFFHSPGGSITGAIELGRLIHDQKLQVSVARTIPRGCDRDKPLDKSCEALKRSGQELEAEFDPLVSMQSASIQKAQEITLFGRISIIERASTTKQLRIATRRSVSIRKARRRAATAIFAHNNKILRTMFK